MPLPRNSHWLCVRPPQDSHLEDSCPSRRRRARRGPVSRERCFQKFTRAAAEHRDRGAGGARRPNLKVDNLRDFCLHRGVSAKIKVAQLARERSSFGTALQLFLWEKGNGAWGVLGEGPPSPPEARACQKDNSVKNKWRCHTQRKSRTTAVGVARRACAPVQTRRTHFSPTVGMLGKRCGRQGTARRGDGSCGGVSGMTAVRVGCHMTS